MRLRAESAFGAQHRVVQVCRNDRKLPEGGAAGPLPLPLAQVGGDREQRSIAGVAMDGERHSLSPETKFSCFAEKLTESCVLLRKVIPINWKEAPQSDLDDGIDLDISARAIALDPLGRIRNRQVRFTTRQSAVKCAGSQIGDGLHSMRAREARKQVGNLASLLEFTDLREYFVNATQRRTPTASSRSRASHMSCLVAPSDSTTDFSRITISQDEILARKDIQIGIANSVAANYAAFPEDWHEIISMPATASIVACTTIVLCNLMVSDFRTNMPPRSGSSDFPCSRASDFPRMSRHQLLQSPRVALGIAEAFSRL